ncbi:hypothetical protein F5Y04DRAFT_182369 [Hypomontagnella monticulosa]|nr:hypothetical protein F5Y04DRAFT_182369 [Hypomontagnella monticulosa]
MRVFSRWPGQAMERQTNSRQVSRLENMGIFKTKIPEKLSFERVVGNKARSPCSLDDFLDYLVYVERNAENLQFFLWYSGYVEKWSQLLELERERSPAWSGNKRPSTRASHTRSSSRSFAGTPRLEERADKLDRILTILDQSAVSKNQQIAPTPVPESESRAGRAETNFSRPRTPVTPSAIKRDVQNEWRWQPFSVQPFRDEVTDIVRHYISTSGPRRLDLTIEDRTACMHALQHTTHPSAFLPAFVAAETTLREQSHTNFIRWSMRNINRPRVQFARVLATVLIVSAFVLDVVFILSKLNRLARLSAVPLWYVGLYIILIEGRGISIRLYMNRKRHLHPWEELKNADPEDTHSEMKTGQAESHNLADLEHKSHDLIGVDVRRKERLQALGPSNKFEEELWPRSYQGKSVWNRIFEVSVVNHNRHLRALQDRAVFSSLLWASFLVVVLTVASVLIPSGNFF